MPTDYTTCTISNLPNVGGQVLLKNKRNIYVLAVAIRPNRNAYELLVMDFTHNEAIKSKVFLPPAFAGAYAVDDDQLLVCSLFKEKLVLLRSQYCTITNNNPDYLPFWAEIPPVDSLNGFTLLVLSLIVLKLSVGLKVFNERLEGKVEFVEVINSQSATNQELDDFYDRMFEALPDEHFSLLHAQVAKELLPEYQFKKYHEVILKYREYLIQQEWHKLEADRLRKEHIKHTEMKRVEERRLDEERRIQEELRIQEERIIQDTRRIQEEGRTLDARRVQVDNIQGHLSRPSNKRDRLTFNGHSTQYSDIEFQPLIKLEDHEIAPYTDLEDVPDTENQADFLSDSDDEIFHTSLKELNFTKVVPGETYTVSAYIVASFPSDWSQICTKTYTYNYYRRKLELSDPVTRELQLIVSDVIPGEIADTQCSTILNKENSLAITISPLQTAAFFKEKSVERLYTKVRDYNERIMKVIYGERKKFHFQVYSTEEIGVKYWRAKGLTVETLFN